MSQSSDSKSDVQITLRPLRSEKVTVENCDRRLSQLQERESILMRCPQCSAWIALMPTEQTVKCCFCGWVFEVVQPVQPPMLSESINREQLGLLVTAIRNGDNQHLTDVLDLVIARVENHARRLITEALKGICNPKTSGPTGVAAAAEGEPAPGPVSGEVRSS